MELMEVILSQSNMERAIKVVKSNKGAHRVIKPDVCIFSFTAKLFKINYTNL